MLKTILIICLLLFGTSSSADLTDDFDRGPTLNDTRGWMGGDGAISVQLPDNGTLWIFGDSFVSAYDPVTRQRTPTPATLSEVVFGNTIAIQREGSIQFYARTYAGAVSDITAGVMGGRAAFFTHEMLGLPPSPGTFLWPQGGECLFCADENLDNDKLALAFTRVQFCNPQVDATCEALCFDGSPREECPTGVHILPPVICQIENPRDPIDTWQAHSTVLDGTSVSWGTSFVEDNEGLYVFGASREGMVVALVVARVNPEDLLNQRHWEYWTRREWHAAAQDLVPAAENVGPLFTVDKLTYKGKTRWILVYDHPIGDHYVYLRTSKNPTKWKPDHKNTVKVNLLLTDESLSTLVEQKTNIGECEPAKPQVCAISYHGLGHAHLSQPGQMLFSYIIPQGPTDGSNNADYYRPRFGVILLDKIRKLRKLSRQVDSLKLDSRAVISLGR